MPNKPLTRLLRGSQNYYGLGLSILKIFALFFARLRVGWAGKSNIRGADGKQMKTTRVSRGGLRFELSTINGVRTGTFRERANRALAIWDFVEGGSWALNGLYK